MTAIPIDIQDDVRDDPKDRVLCAQVGQILAETYPGWQWRVEIPPNNDVVIVRNLDCDPLGKFGFLKRKSQINMGNLRREIALAGGTFLERYEYLKRHAGQFRPDDLKDLNMLLERPED